MAKIGLNDPLCTGCRACELGCSFHFHRYFNPEESAIRVFRDEKDGTIDFDWNPDLCDFCDNEKEKQCLQYCQSNALIVIP